MRLMSLNVGVIDFLIIINRNLTLARDVGHSVYSYVRVQGTHAKLAVDVVFIVRLN